MKIIYPKNSVIKETKIPNFLLFNRVLFGILKLFLITKHILFIKIRYKHIKPIIKMAKEYSGYEIVTVHSKKGDTVRILL